jgi:hypothetical protein
VLGQRLTNGERLTGASLLRALGHDWALLQGAAIPFGALLLAWATGAEQATGVTIALWSAVASLVIFELLAGLRGRATPRELVLEAGVGLALGIAVLSLRIILH